ncbi:putative UPF0481 protein At3g02645 [Carica papaya]|uniref:putative UPF0481 protein At3g02645 n=1 Tax=Carica papaya TaxID=3649 RepID=UPI000B8CA693|nr:putative UPF0481 protein At3g02645 [Carica papaya]
MPFNSNPSLDHTQWVINIRRALEEDLEEDVEAPVCIFNVPKMLLSGDPDLYTPQEIALGPYHCWRPELYEMERYKLAAAKRTQTQLQSLCFQLLVEQLTHVEPRIRACYHKYLDFNGETLAWMMAIDASFLLEFLQIYATIEGKTLSRIPSRMSHFVDYSGRKPGHNAILRDIVMLENQIPLFVLRNILESQLSSAQSADDMLLSMLLGLCREISPFKMEELPMIKIAECTHILDFLYRMIVPLVEETSAEEVESHDHETEQEKGSKWNHLRRLFSKIRQVPVQRIIRKMVSSKPVVVVLRLPWKIFSSLPVFAMFKLPLERLFAWQNEETRTNNMISNDDNNNNNKSPLVEEITIPSVTELSEAGIRFLASNSNILVTDFNIETATIQLPIISLDINTQVLLRNLVAYEAWNGSGPLVFTRYTELMDGIIDTEEDIKLLREKGIILNHLKSDEEAAKLWNGMSKSLRLSKVDFLDKVIEDINKYYNNHWRVRVRKLINQYVYSSWQFLTLMAAVLLLLLVSLQAFCSVYKYARVFRLNNDR